MTTAIGVDIGGSGIKAALVDLDRGTFIGERVRISTPQPATTHAVVGTVHDVVAELGAAGPVGITIPAVVRGGVVESAANIDEGWIGTDARALFGPVLARPLEVLNDADAAGLAEVAYGAGRDRRGVVLMLTLGTGIGSALFVDGVLVPNTEFGHLHLHHGEAEAWASDAARTRDDLSWHHWAERLGHYLRTLESLVQPDLVIIGGGVSRKAERFLPHIELRHAELVAAELQNGAGIIGAARHAPRAAGTSPR